MSTEWTESFCEWLEEYRLGDGARGSYGDDPSGRYADSEPRASIGGICAARRDSGHPPTAHDSRSASCERSFDALCQKRLRYETPDVEATDVTGRVAGSVA
jgi:hypothetical protein